MLGGRVVQVKEVEGEQVKKGKHLRVKGKLTREGKVSGNLSWKGEVWGKMEYRKELWEGECM